MRRRDATIFLEDILENIELIEKFTKNETKGAFRTDIKTQYIVEDITILTNVFTT